MLPHIATETMPKPQSTQSVLFCSVLKSAIEDYKDGRLSWKFFSSNDFEIICDLAEVKADNIRNAARSFTAGVKAEKKREARRNVRYSSNKTRKGVLC